jgi:hypothetical protein
MVHLRGLPGAQLFKTSTLLDQMLANRLFWWWFGGVVLRVGMISESTERISGASNSSWRGHLEA